MKKILYVLIFFISACAQAQPTPTALPTQVMNQNPTPMPTPTLAVIRKPIEGMEQEEAGNFFYELKNEMALGEYHHLVEDIRYPITVNVDGKSMSIVYAAEFDANFEKIFTEEMIQKFISTDESELTFTPDGVKVADGFVWFDLICMDAACEEAEFQITQINN